MKKRIGVIMGGESSEREISLLTGKAIAKNLDKKKFEVKTYDIKKDLLKLFMDCYQRKIDLAFIALHGKLGEDGTIQGMLELLKIPYVGSGVLGSALGMNKIITKKIFEREKIPISKYFYFDLEKFKKNKKNILKRTKIPCVVKPSDSGSSIGVSIVKVRKDLEKAIKKAFKESREVIVENYIKGKEISVPVLGNENPIALPVIEIIPKKEFFSYQAKYDGTTKEIVPARISKKMAQKAQKLAIKAHQSLKCQNLCRVDMILKGNKIYVLEVNTIPGMTEQSLFPKAAKAAGMGFSKLLEKLIKLAETKK